MTIDLYWYPYSPPSRAAMLTAKALNLKVNEIPTELGTGKHMTPEFLKLNPQHTIPTLVDDGFSIWESRAIMAYLVNTYGKNSGLYPDDPKTRAIIDQRLYFDIGTLYNRYSDYYYPQMFGEAPADPEKFKKLEQAVKFLDTFLEGQTYLAGPRLTIADISVAGTVSAFEITDFDLSKYSNVTRWYEKVKAEIPGFKEVNEAGIKTMNAAIEEFKKQ